MIPISSRSLCNFQNHIDQCTVRFLYQTICLWMISGSVIFLMKWILHTSCTSSLRKLVPWSNRRCSGAPWRQKISFTRRCTIASAVWSWVAKVSTHFVRIWQRNSCKLQSVGWPLHHVHTCAGWICSHPQMQISPVSSTWLWIPFLGSFSHLILAGSPNVKTTLLYVAPTSSGGEQIHHFCKGQKMMISRMCSKIQLHNIMNNYKSLRLLSVSNMVSHIYLHP